MAAEGALGSVCGKEPEATLDALGAQIRLSGECAGRLDDAVFIRHGSKAQQDEEDRNHTPSTWGEYHAAAYTDGCWTDRERVYKGTWKYAQ